jgi:hypothetical protein
VSVATPHQGTPLAALFATLLGQKILKLLSVGTMIVLRQGRWPLSILVPFAAAVARLGGPDSKLTALLENLGEDLIGRLERSDRDRVSVFIRSVSGDQALLPQLTPETMDVFNVSASDRPGVRYGCVIARARRPRVRAILSNGLSPTNQAMYGLYTWLHHQIDSEGSRLRPEIASVQSQALVDAYGDLPTSGDNDAIVPTLSQLWGEVIHAVQADHLDVIGHFDDPDHLPPHRDWITTQSGFRRPDFEEVWSKIATFVAEAA